MGVEVPNVHLEYLHGILMSTDNLKMKVQIESKSGLTNRGTMTKMLGYMVDKKLLEKILYDGKKDVKRMMLYRGKRNMVLYVRTKKGEEILEKTSKITEIFGGDEKERKNKDKFYTYHNILSKYMFPTVYTSLGYGPLFSSCFDKLYNEKGFLEINSENDSSIKHFSINEKGKGALKVLDKNLKYLKKHLK